MKFRLKLPALFSLFILSFLPFSLEKIHDRTGDFSRNLTQCKKPFFKKRAKKPVTNTTEYCPCAPFEKTRKHDLRIRGAAFFPQGVLTRQIYHQFWPEGSLEYNYSIFPHLSFFANGAVTGRRGHSLGERHKTTLILVPVTLGIKGRWGCSWWHPYVGFGVGVAYTHIHNFYPFVRQREDHWGFASLFQTGVELDVSESFLIDLFAAYRFNWFAFNHHHNIRATGGLDLGLGAGYRF